MFLFSGGKMTLDLTKHQKLNLVCSLSEAVSLAGCQKNVVEKIANLRSQKAALLREHRTKEKHYGRKLFFSYSLCKIVFELKEDIFFSAKIINENIGFSESLLQGYGQIVPLDFRRLHVSMANWGTLYPHSPAWLATLLIKTSPNSLNLESFRLMDGDHRVIVALGT